MKYFLVLQFLFLFSCAKAIKLSVIHPKKGNAEQTVSTINSGTVEAKHQAELAFGTIGRIAKIHSTVGAIVSQGTLIAELENNDLKAMFDESQKEKSRAEELYKNGLVSISNLDSAKRAAEVAHSNLEKTMIKAPFKGMITSLNLKAAESYQTTTGLDKKSLVQIIDLDKRIVKGEIDEVDLQKIKLGNLARIKIPALNNQILEAKVTKVVPFVSTAKDQDRTSQIELEFLENKILVPVGASADVEVITSTKDNILIIPTNHILGTGKHRYVYTVENDKLKKKNITLGLGNYDRVEVIEGLSESETIASPAEGIELTEDLKVKTELKTWP